MTGPNVYISVDMEGIAGVVHPDHVHRDGFDYTMARGLMSDEANAAAMGALDAGANRVLINDSHGDMRNLLFDRLDPRVEILTGSLKPYSMVQGSELGFDLALFVGYHAGMGALHAVLDHTYAGANVTEITINGRRMNETALNALVLGARGVSVGLVTGDDRCCEEARQILPGCETVAVKWAVSRYSARSLHPVQACRQIREGATMAVRERQRFSPFRMDPPYRLVVTLQNSGMADGAEMMPGTVRVSGTALSFESEDALVIFRAMRAMIRLADYAVPVVRAR